MPDVYSVFALLCLVALIAVALGLSVLRLGRQRDTLNTAHAAALVRISALSGELEEATGRGTALAAALTEANGRADHYQRRADALEGHNVVLYKRGLEDQARCAAAVAERDEVLGHLGEWRIALLGPRDAGTRRAN